MTTTTSAESVAEPVHGWKSGLLLAVLAASQLIIAVDYNIVYVALPSIGSELQFSESSLQWVVSAYALTFGGFLLLGGRAADFISRRPLFVIALALYGISSLMGGLATTPEMLIIARMVQGLGGALLFPVTLAILNTQFEEGHDRNRALGVWAATGAGGAALGALLGGVLTSALGWRWTFFVVVPLAVVVALLAFAVLPGHDRGDRARRTIADYDIGGSIVGTAFALVLVYGLVEGPEVGWASAATGTSLLVAVVLGAAFLAIEARVSSPLMPLRLFRSRSLTGGAIITGLHFAGFGGHFYLMTIWLQDVRGMGALSAGLAFIPLAVAIVLGSHYGGRLTTRVGGRATVILGFVLGVIALGMMSLTLSNGASYTTGMLPWIIVSGLGMGFTWTAQWIVVATGIAHDEQGLATGIASTTQQVGSAIGLAVLIAVTAAMAGSNEASVTELSNGLQWAFATAALLLAIGAVIGATVLPRHVKPETTSVPMAA